MFKKKKAFTLIELLVVVAIIGILSTLAVVALQSSRADSRDARRLADVRQIQKALEMYFLENGSYPSDISSRIASGTTIYMAQIPVAPTPADGSCPTYNNTYTYASTGSSYTLDFCLGSKTGEFDAGGKRATNEGIVTYIPPVPWVCGLDFTDDRDFQQYGTVQIGTQCWMSKNMNYDNGCTSKTWVSGSDLGWCGCYNNDLNNCTIYGKLYQWSAAMASSTTPGVQGICPSGWHVPTSVEFTTLTNYLGGQEVAGGKLKQTGTSTWQSSDGGVTNETGFTGLPSGSRNFYTEQNVGGFSGLGATTYFWSSTLGGANAGFRTLYHSLPVFYSGSNPIFYSYPVRCIKN